MLKRFAIERIDERFRIIVETDESDRSHLAIHPDVAVLTNADHDHVTRYPNLAAVHATFRAFFEGVPLAAISAAGSTPALNTGRVEPGQLHRGCEPVDGDGRDRVTGPDRFKRSGGAPAFAPMCANRRVSVGAHYPWPSLG